jgi:hypothetical protein
MTKYKGTFHAKIKLSTAKLRDNGIASEMDNKWILSPGKRFLFYVSPSTGTVLFASPAPVEY